MLPKAWLVSDLETAFATLAREVDALRARTYASSLQIEAQGKRIEALRKRISAQAARSPKVVLKAHG